ncbi:D-Tyr tRNAtyr deacylase-like domain-containing protein [Neurospora hispaniola]|uniref:D-aminoacyl-tRNA deacylase n=1 Tax=Neurospora hispaniola TaxID=588809 RepID=A0AAJ0MRC3_9PEZI|nr:D-Tyr tRNAtyr deacylase-like domain-containing protein [Neurospora hispaniola]
MEALEDRVFTSWVFAYLSIKNSSANCSIHIETKERKMKAILQRVLSASVTVDNQLVSSIGQGILVLAAVAPGDTVKEAEALASKVIKLKLWDDELGGRWKKNVQDIGGEVLCVSQFTLLASTKKGSKPDFHGALGPDEAKTLYDLFYKKVQEGYKAEKVKNGVFQAMMQVALVNDGPVTLEVSATPAAQQQQQQQQQKKKKEDQKLSQKQQTQPQQGAVEDD